MFSENLINFAPMNWGNIALMFLSLSILNVLVYLVFAKKIIRQENAGIKFLILNIIKDIIWAVFWLLTVEKNKFYFLSIVLIFIVLSLFLYRKVIYELNQL